jgi:Alg9-like mannosyltransferase family
MSTSSTDLSGASSNANGELNAPRERQSARRALASATQDIFLFLVAFRILNGLTVRTFFQPDEYFQSLEPAWQMAFGNESGAWITWACLLSYKTDKESANRLAGMEECAPICHTPYHLRHRLLPRRSCCQSCSTGTCRSRRALSLRTQDLASRLRGTG